MRAETDSEINSVRISQVQSSSNQLEVRLDKLCAKIEELQTDRTKGSERLRQLKESRDKIGARVGGLENKVSELMGWKRLLVTLGAIAAIGMGAALKAIFDSIT